MVIQNFDEQKSSQLVRRKTLANVQIVYPFTECGAVFYYNTKKGKNTDTSNCLCRLLLCTFFFSLKKASNLDEFLRLFSILSIY